MINIPEEVAKPADDQGEIPPAVAEITALDQEEPEDRPYLISFAKYNTDMCEVENLDSGKAKKAIKMLRKIGMEIRSQADFHRKEIHTIRILHKGEYKKLFSGLAEDVELREIKLSQEARIFYFDIESKRLFFVVAITQNHLETKKNRR